MYAMNITHLLSLWMIDPVDDYGIKVCKILAELLQLEN
jgi:hypothetical protein